jgi:hypothetical protein
MSSITTSPTLPGYILSSITVLGRARLLESTLTTAALLSSIAGPEAAVEGPGGELIYPGLNIITTGRDTASSKRLRELLVEPIIACQRQFREISRSLSPAKLDHLEFSPFDDGTEDFIRRSRMTGGDITGSPSPHNPEMAAFRRPTFLLQSPDLQTIRKALPEVLNGSALILSDTLFEQPGTDKEAESLFRELAELIAGRDRPAEGVDKRVGPGRIEMYRGHLFASATKEVIREVLTGYNTSRQVLQHCLLLDTAALPPGKARMDWDKVRLGYSWYYDCVKRILNARRNGGGLQWRLTPVAAEQLHEFTGELNDWSSALSEPLKPFFADLLSFSYRLYWACATTEVGQDSEWVLPFTIETTRKFVEHQKVFLNELIEAAETNEHRKARVTMLRKLSERACIFRDLLRRYSVQRRDVHEPVLNDLISEGLIRLRHDGLLELSDKGKEELAA